MNKKSNRHLQNFLRGVAGYLKVALIQGCPVSYGFFLTCLIIPVLPKTPVSINVFKYNVSDLISPGQNNKLIWYHYEAMALLY